MADPWVRKEVIGDCVLYQGDCLEVMPTLGKVDAVVSDPPYGIGYVHGGGGNSAVYRKRSDRPPGKKIIGDDAPFDPTPILRFGKKQVLWGADHFASRLPDGGMFHVWDKDPKGRLSFDSFSDAEIVWTSWALARQVSRYLWKGLCQEGSGTPRVHPTQKPVPVMEWCLGFVPDAKIILEPYMGSGTTLVACAKTGRKGIGIELDPEYFEIACKRVDEAYRQPDLFIAPPEAPIQKVLL